jgi:hypothetical protein
MLAVLDGINAACGTPAGTSASTVPSANTATCVPAHQPRHRSVVARPRPKAANRQSESYSYGAAGWLNDVDGVGYRSTSSRTPIGKGGKGSSALHVVKDRYGEVQRWSEIQTEGKDLPWWYMGQFIMDDTPTADPYGNAQTVMHLTIPTKAGEKAVCATNTTTLAITSSRTYRRRPSIGSTP